MIKLKDILIKNKIIENKKPINEFVLASLAIGALFKLLMKWYKKNQDVYEKHFGETEEEHGKFIDFENIEKYLEKDD
tara:strand:+ start:184 stop:414 length:231 start_codon:yes stop_codon:yes gene_type:complete